MAHKDMQKPRFTFEYGDPPNEGIEEVRAWTVSEAVARFKEVCPGYQPRLVYYENTPRARFDVNLREMCRLAGC